MRERLVKYRTREVLAAAPSVVAIACVAFAMNNNSTADPPDWYRATADSAFAAGDYHTAAVCYHRLLQSRPTDEAIALNLAESLQSTGQEDGAASLLARLAPEDRPGYLPAQLALARQILSEDAPVASEIDSAERHLKWVLQLTPVDPRAYALLAELYALRGEWEKADVFAGRLGTSVPSLRERLSAIARQQGNTFDVHRWRGPRP
jgi:Flp pilus assembly protein TadD